MSQKLLPFIVKAIEIQIPAIVLSSKPIYRVDYGSVLHPSIDKMQEKVSWKLFSMRT